MSRFQNTVRSVKITGNTYSLRVQGYNFLIDGELQLITSIELFQNNYIIGALSKTHSPNDPVPQFVKLSSSDFQQTKLKYYGEMNFEIAKKELAKLTDENIIAGLKLFFTR
jgi:hypothetical protein